MSGDPLSHDDVVRAAETIRGRVRRTPLLDGSDLAPGLRLKAELFQHTGSFKARGVTNRLAGMGGEERRHGVAGASAGNHAIALAWGAAREGLECVVFSWPAASRFKLDRARGLGARIDVEASDPAGAFARLEEHLAATGATLVHPFDDPEVIAGQGTAALELLEDVDGLDAIIAPCGGGGLLSGTAIAATSLRPGIRVLGAEPANADDAARSFASGRVEPLAPTTTIADGLRTTLAPRTLEALRAHVGAIGTCSEEGIVRAMRMTFERMKQVVEPSSSVPLACLLEGTLDVRGKRVGIIVTGGNVDLDRLPWQSG